MELINLDDEESTDKEAIEFVMKKSKKLFRHLFTKYTNKVHTKKMKNFDSLKSKYELITLGEFKKMLNDHKVGTNIISKEEVAALFRLINSKSQRADVQSLTFEGFVECFLQTALCIHNKPPNCFSCVPLVQSIKNLINQFETASSMRGENILLFTDPEASTLTTKDQDMLQQLNAMIEKSPNYPLPEGYKKVQEKDIFYGYEMKNPDFLAVENIKISAEILDEIILKRMGIHFLEPKAEYGNKTRVCPDLMKVNKPLQLEHPESRKLDDLLDNKGRTWRTEDIKKSKKVMEISWPIIPIHVKMVIAKMPLDMRKIGMEVAGIVEEMIKAVESGKETLRQKGEAFNVAIKKRLDLKEEQKRIELEKEEKRKLRQQQLKMKLERSSLLKEEDKDINNSKPKVDCEQIKKAIEEINKKAEEKANKKKEEKQRVEKEEKLKKREEKEKRMKELEPFIKKKREELEALLKEKVEKIKKKDEEANKREAERKTQIEQERKKLEEEVKSDKEFSEQIHQQNEELSKVFKNNKMNSL